MSTLELAPGQTAYVGRDGKALELLRWAELREDRDYRIVARTEHLDAVVQAEWEGNADTVEVGFMYAIGIRWAGEWTTVWHAHWPCTEAEAKAKHTEIVALLRETCPAGPTWQTRHEFRRRLREIEATVERLVEEAAEAEWPKPEEFLEHIKHRAGQRPAAPAEEN